MFTFKAFYLNLSTCQEREIVIDASTHKDACRQALDLKEPSELVYALKLKWLS